MIVTVTDLRNKPDHSCSRALAQESRDLNSESGTSQIDHLPGAIIFVRNLMYIFSLLKSLDTNEFELCLDRKEFWQV